MNHSLEGRAVAVVLSDITTPAISVTRHKAQQIQYVETVCTSRIYRIFMLMCFDSYRIVMRMDRHVDFVNL